MSKVIKYSICNLVNHEEDETPWVEEVLSPVTMGWSESGEEIARKEAYKGEYIVEDDGEPDPAETPTQLDMIEAQVTYTAMMTDTLLEV